MKAVLRGLFLVMTSFGATQALAADIHMTAPHSVSFEVGNSKVPGRVTAIIAIAGKNQDERPVARVLSQDAGFSCSIRDFFRITGPELLAVYQLEIDWLPGADLSGCVVEYENLTTQERGQIKLYMNF